MTAPFFQTTIFIQNFPASETGMTLVSFFLNPGQGSWDSQTIPTQGTTIQYNSNETYVVDDSSPSAGMEGFMTWKLGTLGSLNLQFDVQPASGSASATLNGQSTVTIGTIPCSVSVDPPSNNQWTIRVNVGTVPHA